LPEPKPSEGSPKEYHHLAVKTKAVHQPIVKLHKWMDKAKAESLDNEPSDANDMPMDIPDVSAHGIGNGRQ
jgi:hypothetical protein